jgi:type I restriction enzyme S subunit
VHLFVQTGDIAERRGRTIHYASQTLNDRGLSVSAKFPAGTIAVTIAANIADTAILGEAMCFPDSVVGVEVRRPNSVRYVELCIRSAKPRLEARAPQSAQKNINLQDLRPLLIPLREPDEQHRIAAVYESCVTRLDAERSQLAKLEVLKQGLMEDLLTGRVRTDMGEEVAV